MTEQLSHELEVAVHDFARQIEERQDLPIDTQDALKFARFIVQYNPPNNFLKNLATGLRYIDEVTFERYVVQIAETAKQLIGNDPYYLVAVASPTSQTWIYKKLISEYGLHDATNIFRMRKMYQT